MSKRNGKPEQLIPAVGYLRKSTRGENPSGRERQEKSLPQQKAETVKLADGRFKIAAWFSDEGISGWKRGSKRPDFQRMLAEVKALAAQAIVCDNIDRFSRATVDEVMVDANELRSAGVRWIVTASHGTYDLGKRHDIGEILKFVVAVWSANEYSRQLGRRITLARRNAALEGKRTGGSVAYGLADDGRGGLKAGDANEVRIVLWIFDQFGNQLRSMNWIAADLNAREVPAPSGGKNARWHPRIVRLILRRRAYRGDYVYNERHQGQFYGIDDMGEVVEASELNGKRKLFVHEGKYKPLVSVALFDKVQRRLDTLGRDRSRRKRLGYALTGILRCGHCGSPMHGVTTNDRIVVYRCSAPPKHGSACGRRQVHQDVILPFIVRMLGREIRDLQSVLSAPPDALRNPASKRTEKREQLRRDRDRLSAQIERAEENLLLSPDSRTFKRLDARLSAMRDQLETLEADLASEEPQSNGYTREELTALAEWWENFDKTAVSVPVDDVPMEAHLHIDPYAEESCVLIDARKVNEALFQLGCEVRLWWETHKSTWSMAASQKKADKLRNRKRAFKQRDHHVLAKGRFRLGQHEGRIPQSVLEPLATRDTTTGR